VAFVWFTSLRTMNLTYVSKMSVHLQRIRGYTYTCKNQLCWCTRLSRDTHCYLLSIHQYLICRITRYLSLRYTWSFNYTATRGKKFNYIYLRSVVSDGFSSVNVISAEIRIRDFDFPRFSDYLI